MSKEDIEAMLLEMNIEFAYNHFEEENYIDPPFLVYLLPKTNNFGADGGVYFKASALNIELYADKKDVELEKQVENVLDQHGIYYERTMETFIDTEKMFMVLYEMEV